MAPRLEAIAAAVLLLSQRAAASPAIGQAAYIRQCYTYASANCQNLASFCRCAGRAIEILLAPIDADPAHRAAIAARTTASAPPSIATIIALQPSKLARLNRTLP